MNSGVLSSKIVDLLLKDIIDLLLVHFLLLLGRKANTTSEFLHLTLYTLSYSLARLVPQKSYHLPATEMQLVESIFGVSKIIQLLLNAILRQLSQVGFCPSYSLRVLDGWVQEHAIYFGLIERVR